ncbi:glycoside hydrolase family 3 C-terminal domain-containing protein [Streptomyces sp. H39-S7]|uniref:glycoside hydrolase family 3 C-terminal domain-containing protein n=1 Tax=Streptomyces sp. H39-S7 TaxID=3004357 RepID=UPI0022AF3F59|nr:glycoside hydrolase family 3 C-terminal domain-containing protein [Streptomyces sp. H39-S7]MCZ4123691.1 glycoside hydrolase family 3 C-terminal domain-containing protein [Streptomyces sp. H39-S7]
MPGTPHLPPPARRGTRRGRPRHLAVLLVAALSTSLTPAVAGSAAQAAPGSEPVPCGITTAALNRPATASSTERADTPAAAAFDGNAGTRWSSAATDPQWLQVDLGADREICGAQLAWETAYAKAYRIQVSDDGAEWTTVHDTTAGQGGIETVALKGTGRYVRLTGLQRATEWGYSLWDFSVLTPGGTGGAPGGGDGTCPWADSSAPVADRVTQLMARMTQSQKIQMLHGTGNRTPYVGNLSAIPSLCIPSVGLHDGPGGVGGGLTGVTQLPSAVSSAATWDTGLQQRYGSVAGKEFAGKGADVALGPTLNIVRDPRWGRAFETYSEDPYLSGEMAVANIRGIQGEGVMAQAKHVAVYNQETNRNGPKDNAIVDTRTLQEIYLPGFQTAVSKGAAASVMCGYSTVNGAYDCQHPYLLNTALYEQADFGGFVTSDWGGTHSTVESANSGMTMEMPGGSFYSNLLAQAVADGKVTQATLDTMVSRVLTQMFAFGLFDKQRTGSTTAVVTSAAHRATARQIAEQGSVLLKNTGLLPLSTASTHSIALLGPDAGAGVRSVGGGSAVVTSSGTVSPLTGIQNRVAGTGTTVQYNDGKDIAAAVALARASDVAVVCVGYMEGEGADLKGIDLTAAQNDLVTQVAAANPRTVVVLNTGSAVTMPWLGRVQAVLEEWYAGQEVGNAVARLLFGDTNPSGKLPVTFPASLADVPAHTAAQWPGTDGTVQYSEGLKVGYRWYDAGDVTPLFPFGFGLSYTTFSFSGLQVGTPDASGATTVSATVTNTGDRAGAEIAQLYVGAPASTGEPVRQLRGFQRVELQPGESGRVAFTVTAHDLAHWSDTTDGWTTTPGAYRILVGASSRDLPLTGTLTVGTPLSARTVTGTATATGSVAVTNPHGMSSRTGAPVRLAIAARTTGSAGPAPVFAATGLPKGLSISRAGVISGTATAPGTSTVSVTATAPTGATGTAGFVWTVSRS